MTEIEKRSENLRRLIESNAVKIPPPAIDRRLFAELPIEKTRTQLVVCSSRSVFQRWTGNRSRRNLTYLHSLDQLRGRSPESNTILLLEDWKDSHLLKEKGAWHYIDARFPGWSEQTPIALPWLELRRDLDNYRNGDEQAQVNFGKRFAVSKTWHSCACCVYFLAGNPSACNGLKSLPADKVAENNCPEFEKRPSIF